MPIKQKIMKETEVSIEPKFNIGDIVINSKQSQDESGQIRVMKINNIIVEKGVIKYFMRCGFDMYFYYEDQIELYK